MTHYTRGGDKGRTSLANGQRIDKDHLLMEIVGTLDELNSLVGWLAAKAPATLAGHLPEVQRRLFAIGAYAGGVDEPKGMPTAQTLEALEAEINTLGRGEDMEFRGFILPGGEESAALAHVCRTVCRRAERRYVAWLKDEKAEASPQAATVLPYLNRLSTYFYVLAKKINIFYRKAEIIL